MASPQGLLASIVLVGCACAPAPEVVRPDDLAASVPGASTLVVVYSRNGHTAEMGRALAKALGGDFLRLQSPGNEGGSFFTTPAWTSRLPVTPDAVDLSRYKLVLVGGPVWYWHPNAVTNSFIQSHDFTGKDVVLFYTFEGGQMSEGTQEIWKKWVTDRGGRIRDVVGIDRKQLPADRSIAAEAERIARERQASWTPVPEKAK
jgi:flavodoxin